MHAKNFGIKDTKKKQCFFDWYAQYPELKQTLQQHYSLQKDHSILMVGCGNSKLSQQMYQAGYSKICNIDISPTVIEQMKKHTQGMNMEWLTMDATAMTFSDGTFDCVIDKGTMDALISGKNLGPCQLMIRQCIRVMKKDGQLMLITYGSPEGRKKLYESALGFSLYDYYFSRVDLNNMSTLINLMRSNLGGKPLAQITAEKQILAKSMMEYSLVQALRKKRKNQNYMIGWNKFQKKQVKFTQENQDQNHKKQQIKQQQSKTQQNKQKQNQQQKKQQQSKTQQILPKNTQENKKIIYNPKKQCYCFVYSIRHKKFSDLLTVLSQFKNLNLNQLLSSIKSYQAGQNNKKIDFLGQAGYPIINLDIESQQIIKNVVEAIKYLEIINKPHGKISIGSQNQLNQQEGVIKIIHGQTNSINILRKSQITFQVQKNQSSKMTSFQNFMDFFVRQLIEEYDLHPSPKSYCMLESLKDKVNLNMINTLKKYWYPSWKYGDIDSDSTKVVISLPPISPLNQIQKVLIKKLKSRKLKILSRNQGYLNYIDSKLIQVLNLASLSFNDAEKMKLIIEEFSNQFEQNSKLTIQLKQNISYIIARMLSMKN